MEIELSLKVGSDLHEVPHPEQASIPRFFMGGWWIEQNTGKSHRDKETILPEVWPSMWKCAQK